MLMLATLLVAITPSAWGLHVVSDAIPDGALRVPARGHAKVVLDINASDFLQWTWAEANTRSNDLSTQLFWTDTSGEEHGVDPAPAGQTFGNFEAPKNLTGARLEWHNAGMTARVVTWSYYTSAAFWKRPEYFLPAMLPLFLLAGAFYFGRRIDRRRRVSSNETTVGAAASNSP